MSDRAAEAGFAPVRLSEAMARGGGFRPLSFASAPQTAPEEPENLDEIGLDDPFALGLAEGQRLAERSEEHTPELQSLMRISYAVFCLKKNTTIPQHNQTN